MNKKPIALILTSSAFMVLCGYVFYQTFYKYQSDVDQILAEISAEDKDLPPTVLKVLQNMRSVTIINQFVTTNILIDINKKEAKISRLNFILYHFIWSQVLPLRIGEKEVFGNYTNKVYFGNHGKNEIGGFKNAAKFYFQKNLNELVEAEVLVLLTIANSHSVFSHYKNSDLFSERLREMTETYHRNSGN